MITLSGKNLGERQRELNVKVKEAAASNLPFDQLKNSDEKSDIDTFFKIDLASKHMDVDYILEILKSGDSLHISRALKCSWMYDDDFANIMNTENLHNNIFPTMSVKMKKKLLSVISTRVKCKDRAAAFYKYCMETKLKNIALKFLINTSDTFKLELLQRDGELAFMIYLAEGNYVKKIIGASFTLTDAYVTSLGNTQRLQVFINVCYLNSISETKYLDLLEKHVTINDPGTCFGLRFSKNILKKHKNRVLNKPQLYVKILNKDALVKLSTVDEVKLYLAALMPQDFEYYWGRKFCVEYEYLINKIPAQEKFEYLKKIFKNSYPDKEFETDVNFFKQRCYEFMTTEEKEIWAHHHISSQSDILGIGKDYVWYKFVNFDKAFEDIKKMVMITSDTTKRADMVKILIETAKTQCDLEQLFSYYYARHVNEQTYIKEIFIDKVLKHHNVYEFDQDCWSAFNKILHSLEVYSMLNYNSKTNYQIIVLIYCVLNNKQVHEAIILFINTNMYFYSLKLSTDTLTKEQQEIVYQYLYNYYLSKITEFDNEPYNEELKVKVRKYINFLLNLMSQYQKPKEDITETVTKFIKLDWDEFKCHRLLYKPGTIKKITQDDLLHYLKKDAKLLVEKLPIVQQNIENDYSFRINTLLRKLKIYFSNDIAKEFLIFFKKMLESKDSRYLKELNAAAHGIFQLADEKFKTEFMLKYVPTEPKINHSAMNERLLNIQRAICAQVLYARPPVPLKNTLMYIKGDYVHFCLPLFNSYLANLPLPLCMEFVESLLDTPVSIQKHGLRLAFLSFSADKIQTKFVQIWKRTKNVSLRAIMYQAIIKKLEDNVQSQDTRNLFETLKLFTMELHEDDDSEIFSLIKSNSIPKVFISEFITVAWTTVSKFDNKSVNIKYKISILEYMTRKIELMSQDTLQDIINDFIPKILDNIAPELILLYKAKWGLAATYITYLRNGDDIQPKLKLVESVLKHLDASAKDVRDERYYVQEKCIKFIEDLENTSYDHNTESFENINTLLSCILQSLQNRLSLEKIYILVWELRLGIIARTAIFMIHDKIGYKRDIAETNTVVRDSCINFANGLGNIYKEFVDKRVYCASLFDELRTEVCSYISVIRRHVTLTDEDLMVVVSYGLMEFKMSETYLLALSLLPSDYDGVYVDDYKYVLNEIKGLENIDIRCKMYHKFVNADYKVRECLQSLL